MLSNKRFKKVLMYIIITLLSFSLVSFVVTKLVYDGIFTRYDCDISDYPAEFEHMVEYREKLSFPCGEHMLSGFLYKADTEIRKDNLIVLAPGYKACSDNYLWQICELLDCGWSVFVFDSTGSCHSEGNSSVGFPQEILDLKAALDYLEANDNLGFSHITLLGHSRGGYAACCALSFDYDISAVVSISGVNSAMDAIMATSANYVGPLAYGNYGFLWLYQTMLFGTDLVNLRADEIISQTDTPVLLIHGTDDENFPTNRFSIVSHKDSIHNSNVQILLRTSPDNSGHTDLLFSKDGTADDEIIKEINVFLQNALDKKGDY